MMRLGLLVSAVVMLLLSSSVFAGRGRTYAPEVLRLKDCLQVVRSGKHEGDFDSPCEGADLSSLVGLARSDIKKLFGTPDKCMSGQSEDVDDWQETTKCDTADHWWFTFSSPAVVPDRTGGDANMVLTFDRFELVARHTWVMGQ
jgi:hypothetical protein